MPKHSRKLDLELSMPTCVPPTKSTKHTTACKAGSPCKLAKSSDTAAEINIPASETPFSIKDAVLRELIGLGKVQVVTKSSKLSRS